MRKMVACTLAVLLLLGIVAISLGEVMMTPRYSNTSEITAFLSFKNGKAQCNGKVRPSGSENCSVKHVFPTGASCTGLAKCSVRPERVRIVLRLRKTCRLI